MAAVEAGTYGDLITPDRLFYRSFIDRPEVGALMLNLLRYILSPGAKTQYRKGELGYVIHTGAWLAIYNTRDTDEIPRRRLKKLESDYHVIRTEGCRHQPENMKGTLVYVDWARLEERLEEAKKYLLDGYKELELALLVPGGILTPRPIPVIPFELVLRRSLQARMNSSPERTLAAVSDFVRGEGTIAQAFGRQGFPDLHMELEEVESLHLDPTGWRLSARLAEALRPFRNLLGAPYVTFTQKTMPHNRFHSGDLDLMVAQFVGVTLTVHRDVIDVQPRDFGDAVFHHKAYLDRCRASFKVLGRSFSPLENLVINEGLRLGWIESCTLGKGKHYKSLFVELLTDQEYTHLDHVQCMGIFLKLFPEANSLFKQLVPLSAKLQWSRIEEDMKPLYQALYPGLLQRLEDLSRKHANTG